MITICTGPMPVSTAFDLVPLREFLPSRPTGSCWPRRGVLPGDAEAREFIAFWLRSGQVLAGMNVNIWDVSDIIQALVRTQKTSPQTDREGAGACGESRMRKKRMPLAERQQETTASWLAPPLAAGVTGRISTREHHDPDAERERGGPGRVVRGVPVHDVGAAEEEPAAEEQPAFDLHVQDPYFRALSMAGIVCSIPRDSRPHLMSG